MKLNGKMNRSFVYGIIVASTTWCFSLYLYWLLMKNPTNTSPANIQWSPNQDTQEYVALKHNNAPKNHNQLDIDEKQQRIHDQKDFLYKKYKKEKKFRKISQRLQDELKPVDVNGGPGNFKNQFFFFHFLRYLLIDLILFIFLK